MCNSRQFASNFQHVSTYNAEVMAVDGDIDLF